MPNTPQDPNFTPRKEFLRDQRTTSAFSLLAVSGSSLIRLYSFPPPLITSLRRLFDQQSLTVAFREDAPQCLYEFTLDGKPWSSPKSVQSEKLLVNILLIIYQHGYAFLSTIDYGREHDDRLAIAFSKPAFLSSSPGSVPPSPLPNGSASNLSYSTGERALKRIPFAISFSSATLLRVINPPLHSTPAILQAVRGSWPRGVVSERKIGDASYEFKLKGYKWFQEDTFASDSLRHILTLLSSLDAHAFTLIASISLTNRSRVKDLWIFTGLVPADGQDAPSDSAGSLNIPSSNGVTLKVDHNAISQSPAYVGPVPQHKRHPTAPMGATYPQSQLHPHSPLAKGHIRSATDRAGPPGSLHASSSGGILRKPAPRAQVPVSVNLDAPMDVEPTRGQEQEQFRALLPSVISSTTENMTGVGAAARGGRDPMYTPDKVDGSYIGRFPSPGGPISTPKQPNSPSPPSRLSPGQPSSTQAKTPPLSPLSPLTSPGAPHGVLPQQSHSPQQPDQAGHDKSHTAPLLASGVFAGDILRESAASAASSATDGTDTTQEIPIKWTGGVSVESAGSTGKIERPEGGKLKRVSTGPHVPGAWTGSPDEDSATPASPDEDSETEKGVDTSATASQTRALTQEKRPERPLHDVDARVASPELVMNYDDEMRKSEAGLIGVMTSTSPPEKKEPQPRSPKKEGSGNGWVLVNVEGKPRPQPETQPTNRPGIHARDTSKTMKASESDTPNSSLTATMSPAAKSIVIIDAKEAKRTKAKGKGKGKAESKDFGTDSHRSGLRRLLSFSKRGDTLDEPAPSSASSTGNTAEGQPLRKKPSPARLHDRLKLPGATKT